MLTKAQIQSFLDDGYLVVPSMYEAEMVDKISLWSDEILA